MKPCFELFIRSIKLSSIKGSQLHSSDFSCSNKGVQGNHFLCKKLLSVFLICCDCKG